jgi:hypothetical protein
MGIIPFFLFLNEKGSPISTLSLERDLYFTFLDREKPSISFLFLNKEGKPPIPPLSKE